MWRYEGVATLDKDGAKTLTRSSSSNAAQQSIGERIQAALKVVGLTQVELAERAGCQPASISQIVSGKTQSSRFLPVIAQVLGVPVSYLLGEAASAFDVKTVGQISPEEHSFLAQFRYLSGDDRRSLLRILDALETRPCGDKAE